MVLSAAATTPLSTQSVATHAASTVPKPASLPPIVIVTMPGRGRSAARASTCAGWPLYGLTTSLVCAPLQARFVPARPRAAAASRGQASALLSHPAADGSKGGLASPEE